METLINIILFFLGILGFQYELKIRPVIEINTDSVIIFSKDLGLITKGFVSIDLEEIFENCLRRNEGCDGIEKIFEKLHDPFIFNERCLENDRYACLLSGIIYKYNGEDVRGEFNIRKAMDLGIVYAEALGEIVAKFEDNGCKTNSKISFQELCFRGYGKFCHLVSEEYFYGENKIEEAEHFLKLASWNGIKDLENDFERIKVARLIENRQIYQILDRCIKGNVASCAQALKLDLISDNPINLDIYFEKACELGLESACYSISNQKKKWSEEVFYQLEKCLEGMKSFCHIIKRQVYNRESYSNTTGNQSYEIKEIIEDEEIMQRVGINYLIDDCHDERNGDACLKAAYFIEWEMSGKSENIKLHESLLQKGCLMQSEEACQMLINLYRGFTKVDRVREWLKKSCDLGHLYHCREFFELKHDAFSSLF